MGLFDGYQRGAEAAKADGGKNKLTARALEEFARNGFGLIPGAQNREDEFRHGYSETYQAMARDTQRDVPVHFSTSTTSTAFNQSTQGDFTMSNNQPANGVNGLTLEAQRDLFISLRDYLIQFEVGLSKANFKYKNQMQALESVLISNYHFRLMQEHVEPIITANSDIGNSILTNNAPILWNHISSINAQIVRFGGSTDDQKFTNLLAGIVKPDLSTGSTSVDPYSWGSQIELLDNLIGFLRRLEVSFSLFQIDYRQKVGLLEGILMKNDYNAFVEKHMDPTIQSIQKIREYIQSETIPFVNSIISEIQNRPSY